MPVAVSRQIEQLPNQLLKLNGSILAAYIIGEMWTVFITIQQTISDDNKQQTISDETKRGIALLFWVYGIIKNC